MNETVVFAAAPVTGILIGLIFFHGLWWTVRKGVSSKRPALLFLSSLVLRMGVALAGFYFVSGGHLKRLLLCLLGFLIARYFVMRYTRSQKEATLTAQEAGHAA